MDADTELTGSPITLAELKELGEFERWQNLEARVADLVAAKRLPDGYPLVASRLPASGMIDLCVDRQWQRVRFIRMDGSPSSGDQRVVYLENGVEKTARYDWYDIAPAGHYTAWQGRRPQALEGAKLLDGFALAQQDHVIHSQALVDEHWPYLTFEVASCHPKARWVNREDMWTGSYTVHAADPRVKVEGITPREPWFNTTIAVSHRWLSPEHPDPDGAQYREFLALCETLGFHDNQAFLIDYCSLPQHPREPGEESWFRDHLPGFQSQFKYVTVVLNAGSADYSTRAWCMLELMLAALNDSSSPILLNHDRLDGPLRDAHQLAQNYVKQTKWSGMQMSKALALGVTPRNFGEWAYDPMNTALYNASIGGRRAVLDKFENELTVTDPNDRPIIISLLKQLAFGDPGP